MTETKRISWKLFSFSSRNECFALVLLATFASLFWSCERPEERLSLNPKKALTFSEDTLFFDTLITTLQSNTKRLYAYNPNRNAVEIEQLRLEGHPAAEYRLIVNGKEGQSHQNIVLQGKDSLLILAEITADRSTENLPFLLDGKLVVELSNRTQEVPFWAWGQGAFFLKDSVMSGDIFWENTKPYVLLGDGVLVDENSTLNIQEGVEVHLAPGASLFVNGTLKATGSAESPICFGGTRLEYDWQDIPGQWGGIIFGANSQGNSLAFTKIKNGTLGVRIGSPPDQDTIPELTLAQVEIGNMTAAGIVGFSADISLQNCLVYNCLEYTAAFQGGGDITAQHCTFANYSFDFFRETSQILLTNWIPNEGEILAHDLNFFLQNSIVWGSLEEEFELDLDPNASFNFNGQNNFLRTAQEAIPSENQFLMLDPKFAAPSLADYGLDSLSAAKNAALPSAIQIDLKGNPRDSQPDIGALERQE